MDSAIYTPEAIANNYAAGIQSRNQDVSADVLTPLTGGGVGYEPCLAIAEALAACRARYSGDPVEPAWLGGWQEEACRFAFEHTHVIDQEPRQFGKTYKIGIIITNYIGAGHRCFIAMPTLSQSARLIFRQVKQNLALLSHTFPALQLRSGYGNTDTVANQSEILLETGAGMVALSSDPESQKEGYTGSLLVFDEGHNTTVKVVDMMAPFVQRAMVKGTGKIIVLGVGGPIDSAIEKKKSQGFNALRLPASEIMRRWPTDNIGRPIAPIFEKAKRTMSPQMYAQHYELQPVSAGRRRLFPKLLDKLTGLDSAFGEYLVTFDAGYESDETWMSIGINYPGLNALRVIDHQVYANMLHEDIANAAAKYLYDRYINQGVTILSHNTACEGNGPGEMLSRRLERVPPFTNINRIYSTDTAPQGQLGSKSFWLTELMNLSQEGGLSIEDAELHELLSDLMFERKPDGTYDWPPSDALSTVWLMQAMRASAIGA